MSGGKRGRPPKKRQKIEPQALKFVPVLSMSSFQVDFSNIPVQYTLEEVKKFHHPYLVTDKEVLAKIEDMNKLLMQLRKFKPPDDKMIFSLNQYLNKITTGSDKIMKLAMSLVNEEFFVDESFIQTFSEKIVDSSIEQNMLSKLYSRFLRIIYNNIPTIEQREELIYLIHQEIFNNRDKTNSLYQFIGCLLVEGFVTADQILEIFDSIKQTVTNESIEAIYHLFRCCFHELLSKSTEFEPKLLEFIKSTQNNKEIKSRIRFLMEDFADEFKAGKNTGNLDKNVSSIEEIKQNDIFADIKSSLLLSKYINNNEIPNRWNTQFTFEYLASLLMSPLKDFNKGLSMIKILLERSDLIFKETLIPNLKLLMKHAKKFHEGLNRLGAIYANMLTNGFILDENENIFENNVFVGFVSELRRLDRIDFIETSELFQNYKFLPKLRSHSQIICDLEENNIIDVFPLYNEMYSIFNIIKNDQDEKDIIDILKKDRQESEKVILLEYITEIIVIQCPSKYKSLLQYVARRPVQSLNHIEVIGELFEWKPDQTATSIYNLVPLILYDVDEFKNMPGSEYHTRVCSYL